MLLHAVHLGYRLVDLVDKLQFKEIFMSSYVWVSR